MNKEKLTEFLYLLMRDAAPMGEVCRVVQMVDVNSIQEVIYSSPELRALAERYAVTPLGKK